MSSWHTWWSYQAVVKPHLCLGIHRNTQLFLQQTKYTSNIWTCFLCMSYRNILIQSIDHILTIYMYMTGLWLVSLFFIAFTYKLFYIAFDYSFLFEMGIPNSEMLAPPLIPSIYICNLTMNSIFLCTCVIEARNLNMSCVNTYEASVCLNKFLLCCIQTY